jgi:porphobilinogen synthase
MYQRPRRNRRTEAIRGMVRETRLSVDNLVYPLFLVGGENTKDEIASLPGNYRFSLDMLLADMEESYDLGLRNFILFPSIPDQHKDKTGSYGYDPDNFYLKAATRIKEQFPDCTLISDAALDPIQRRRARRDCQERGDRE